ncbi:Serine-threonine kinase receptor-associated [Heracleum sosnowskyi]|uniref:Serine-threonine kinase receptor-associated n=1 Tax=Heracleum sosnowskyi TaxID=360622 RepID=A0AAD8N0R7_9APIA|nr:Serine-threonine kinase receptor-associated [Heracleum sosnowskyi]
MSALSLRRSKDPTSGTKLTAVKPTITSKPIKSTTPVTKSLMGSSGKDSIKRSSGKENPRPISRIGGFDGSVKPVIRNVPRIEKGSGGFDNRLRWSTSSVPRGRSESPCDFSRGFSGVSKARVLDSGKEKKGAFRDSNARNGGSGEIKGRGLRSLGRSVVGLEKSSDLGKDLEVELKGSENSMNRGFGNGGGNRAREESRGRCSVRLRSSEGVEKGVKEVGRASLSRSSSLNVSNGKCGSGGGGTVSGSKYPSKLHEKLAFLEGKVKRIASDIKKTKEILDSSNTEVSKVIITDIQEKISGIEKVMGNVVDTTGSKMGVVDRACEDREQIYVAGMSQNDVDQVRSSAKGLNTEELEARLFLHHKLLKDRTALKTSVEGLLSGSQTGECDVKEIASASKMEEKVFIPIDENPIAAEFLASLKDEQSKDTNRGDNQNLKFGAVEEMDGAGNSAARGSSNMVTGGNSSELVLTTNETLDEFDDQENVPTMVIDEESEENCIYQLNDIGHKTTTGGWFVSDGESILLAHDDSSCTFYDVAHCEEKAEYRPPVGVSPNVWRDCWVIRAPSADGCSGKYVVAASAGNTMESGFCSWDFYTKEVRAVHIEDGAINTRTALAPLPNNTLHRRNTLSSIMAPENQQWWYKPSGPLIISTASHQRVVKVYDIRDGEHIMKWEVQKSVQAMDYSSPLQWRNRGKVVIAEAENISLWDVDSLNPQSLVSVSLFGRKISALHVNNTDAEMGGGVRQRVSSSEAEGNDGVFCTSDSLNILDFRHPTGVGLKIPKLGTSAQSVFSRGDSIYIGCTNLKPSMKKQSCSQVLQFSLRKQRLVSTYTLPESNAHSHYTTMTQVWGNSNLVMGACGLGLFAFDAFDDQMQSCSSDYGIMQKVRDVIGPDDMYSPSFDYLGSRVLLISRDRPAMWRYLL